MTTEEDRAVPEAVMDHLRRIFVPEAVPAVISRPAEIFGGKSAVAYVADGDGTWEQVLAEYEKLTGWQVTQ